MKWVDIKEKYPNSWVHLKILNKNRKDDVILVDEVELISVIESDNDARDILLKCTGDNFVYHTSKDMIEIEVRRRFGFRVRQKCGGGGCE